MRKSAKFRAALLAACVCLAGCGGAGDDSDAGAQGPASEAPPTSPAGASGDESAVNFSPLAWVNPEPATQFTLADGTLVTKIGGRVRDRHAREESDTPDDGEGGGTVGDNYSFFAAHYFERRTHEITIYDNVSPANPSNHILTIAVTPQWWLYGTNFREGYIGRRSEDPETPTAEALYADNGGMKWLPGGTITQTPIPNYDTLAGDPQNGSYVTATTPDPVPGQFVLVKQLDTQSVLRRPLQAGDLVEFELGIFLAGDGDGAANAPLGRFNYYADVIVYKVGQTGVHAWYRGPCCDLVVPWDTTLLPDAALAGGQMMTLQEDTSGEPAFSFSQAGTNIADTNIQPWVEGRRLFHTSFLTGDHNEAGNPPFTIQAGKAGPKFQQDSCIACHIANGKSTPAQGTPLNNMVVLVGDMDGGGKVIPDSRFGTHLEQGMVAADGSTFDGRQATLAVDSYTQTGGQYPDGTAYTLQTPHYVLKDLAGNPIALPPHMSVRTAPQLVGMGLLEAVPETELQALAAAGAHDPDGAAGRLQIVADAHDPTVSRVGRFGWRATSATVEQQIVNALNQDMGVTTTLLPKHECGLAAGGTDCRAADAAGPELGDDDVGRLVRYTSLLAVPSARHFPGEAPLGKTTAGVPAEQALQTRVAQGSALFTQARCSACHAGTLTTGGGHLFAELRNQTIHPYTDLLLHDMGPELADSYPQGRASQQEWRTAPLWGLGLVDSITPTVRYMHDGRARSVEEAILWHGGQAAASRDRFKAFSADERQMLIDFVKSL